MTRIGYYSAARTDLIDLIRGDELNVLEVGCAEGATGVLLLERRIARRVTGIEMHEPSARLAEARLNEVFAGDVVDFLPNLHGRDYDCVILGDILEHLVDPWSVLREIRFTVSREARLVVSIPNVRYYPVVCSLLLRADWRYAPDGVLDETHLRFFTLKSAIRMFSQCGLVVEEIRPYFTGRRYKHLDRASAGLLSGFLAQRFLLRLAYGSG